AYIGEGRGNLYVCTTAFRGLRQEPADQSQPETAKGSGIQKPKQTPYDKRCRDDLSDSGSDLGRANNVTIDGPDNRAQDSAAVERISRNHVEQRKRNVDITKPGEAGP